MKLALLLVAAQASGMATWEEDRKAFSPYKACVLERASLYAKKNGTVESITAAAFSDCRSKKYITLINGLENALNIDAKSGNLSGKTADGMNQNFDELEKMLREDIAATVLRARVK